MKTKLTNEQIYGLLLCKQILKEDNSKSKKDKAIIEAEMLYREGKENLRRLAVLIMILGIGLIIYL